MKGHGREVTIEGARLIVCVDCAARFASPSESPSAPSPSRPKQMPAWSGAEPPASPRPPRPVRPVTKKPLPKRVPSDAPTIDDMILVEDYAQLIRAARQRKGLSQEDLAQKVGERISTLQAIESGRIKPTGRVTRGLERELGISLLEPVGIPALKIARESGQAGPTLGDVVKVKRKKSQKAE
ncbi:MAG: TIGR00270 family protein [Candidatus Thorarchaeota archaeon]|nr:TIGR00270 family protein [Candidatus Thorarchaeota archaeon]